MATLNKAVFDVANNITGNVLKRLDVSNSETEKNFWLAKSNYEMDAVLASIKSDSLAFVDTKCAHLIARSQIESAGYKFPLAKA